MRKFEVSGNVVAQVTYEIVVSLNWWGDADSLEAVSNEEGTRMVEDALRRGVEELFGWPTGRSKVSFRSPLRIVSDEVVDLDIANVEIDSISIEPLAQQESGRKG